MSVAFTINILKLHCFYYKYFKIISSNCVSPCTLSVFVWIRTVLNYHPVASAPVDLTSYFNKVKLTYCSIKSFIGIGVYVCVCVYVVTKKYNLREWKKCSLHKVSFLLGLSVNWEYFADNKCILLIHLLWFNSWPNSDLIHV